MPRSGSSVLLAGALLALLLPQRASAAHHVEVWYDYGLGYFLSGGEGTRHPNSERTGGLAVSLAGDRVRLRLRRNSAPTEKPSCGEASCLAANKASCGEALELR